MNWIFLLLTILLMKGDSDMKNAAEIKGNIMELIEEKLKDPNITAGDIRELAIAYSELTKNDFLKDMWDKTSSYGALGTVGSEQYQIQSVPQEDGK